MEMVDELRDRCGFPFVITSGYRSPQHPIEAKKDVTKDSSYLFNEIFSFGTKFIRVGSRVKVMINTKVHVISIFFYHIEMSLEV